MKIIKPYAKILGTCITDDGIEDTFCRECGIRLLQRCEYAARISHRIEDKITVDSYDKFLRFIVLEHGDFSVIEHASVSVEAVVDRGITHEWVRHRLGAYTQESTRFVNYGKSKDGIKFIDTEPNFDMDTIMGNSNRAIIETHLMNGEKIYLELINRKVSPQIARSILPNALASKILVTYNLRQWRHFFLMRTSKETHPQFKEVTIPLLKEFQEKIPILYEDIIPEGKQSENMRKLR